MPYNTAPPSAKPPSATPEFGSLSVVVLINAVMGIDRGRTGSFGPEIPMLQSFSLPMRSGSCCLPGFLLEIDTKLSHLPK
ncbi:hypothetical protein MCOR29_003462 [Pyricularia oryzae]|uniref:Uncharacterized protein n=1 Tax=Pyricularia oryzae TaxID=318829 RepID=A0A4P7NQ85_PYROR|nr:hypothetical protein MCOR01_002465 [Pyricularia oryzae]KAI6278906.1 hypothetical protein MCOR26_004427 [Pyricularia oryzae]KAI6326507.1 hypothetical protein MCOR29_003462 [Pyricularia oryzae]KAI6403492.1 hypothetical protein MCOR23_003469 [Pyricularia oryzae]KAI6505242.1 hypothetical protein MCOR13_004332 [Pyricularia oryzae]